MAQRGDGAGRSTTGLVDNHLLAVTHCFAHCPRKIQSVKFVKALNIDADDVDVTIVGVVIEHVPVGDIALVAQRRHIGRIQPGIFGDTTDHKGATLADQRGITPLFLLRFGQSFSWNEPGVVAARVGYNPEAITSQEYRSTVGAGVCGIDTGVHRRGSRHTGLSLPQATGNQYH